MALKQSLPRTSPEAQGISSAGILAFLDGVAENPGELHSFILARRGKIAAEGYWKPYTVERQHLLYSLSKSFTSTAAGFAVQEGFLSLDDLVVTFFPEDVPAEISPNLAAMKVRHLLMMGTGHETEPQFWSCEDGNWAKTFLAAPVEKEPGTHFLYNTAATYMVSAIVKKATGQDIVEFLKPRLFEPLDIKEPATERCPRGIPFGGSGLYLTTNDIAKFGQLYLQRGMWNGERLLSEAWIDEATSKQISNGDGGENDWGQGYGFQFWRCRHGAYRGDGAFGQYCVVLPEQEAVIAITSGIPDMGRILNLIWERLLPAMQSAPLPAAPEAEEKLRQRLESLTIIAPEGAPSSPTAAQISGKMYHFPENDQKIQSVRLDFAPTVGDNRATLFVHDDRGEHTVEIGVGSWREGETTFLKNRLGDRIPFNALAVAGQGTWTDENTFAAKICLLSTPSCPTITFAFAGEEMTVTVRGNIGFGPSERAPIVSV